MTKEPPDDEMALVTVTGEDASLSLEGAAEQLGVEPADLDGEFGVVPIDPRRNLYAVQVRADRLPPDFASSEPFRGPFASPEIAPFGLDDERETTKRSK